MHIVCGLLGSLWLRLLCLLLCDATVIANVEGIAVAMFVVGELAALRVRVMSWLVGWRWGVGLVWGVGWRAGWLAGGIGIVVATVMVIAAIP